MRCLNISELWELSQLEVIRDPYNLDPGRLVQLEIEKGELFEKKKQRWRFWKISEVNIEDEVWQMAFLFGIYSGGPGN